MTSFRPLPARARRLAPFAFALLLVFAARTSSAEAPTSEQRVAYWLDRLVQGAEPTTYLIPNFHQGLLLDAERNLVALGDATLDRLADPKFRERVQANPDANTWHAILTVLVPLAKRRPDVARAWANPALEKPLLTLRRAALPVLEALSDPADGPLLTAVLARDAEDRTLGPMAAKTLLRLGPPWDAAAASLMFERGTADRPDGTSGAWTQFPTALQEARGAARPEVLAWWALLTEASGPRAKDPTPPAGKPARHLDPTHMIVVPLEHAMTSSRIPAAEARSLLAKSGFAPYVASAQRDLESADPTIVARAREGLRRAATPAERAQIRTRANEILGRLSKGVPGDAPSDVAALAMALETDEDPHAASILHHLLDAYPTSIAWKDAIVATYDALLHRREEPLGYVQGLLRSGDPSRVDLALFLIRHAKSAEFVPLLETWMEDLGSEPYRLRARRELLFLCAYRMQNGGISTEDVAPFMPRLQSWIEDPADPSAIGFVGTLLELGPPGEKVLAEGLRGPRRALYLAPLARAAAHYVSLEVVEALLAPLSATTPVDQFRATLDAVFYVAPGDAAPLLEALAARLPEPRRADVEFLLRIVRHRAS